MKVTPLELRQRQFATVMRGYDRAEVNTILAHAADDYEATLLENERLRQELGKFEAVLNEHRGQEKHLSNTLLTAQRLADDIRDKAQQEAAKIVSDAEARAVLAVEKSQARLAEVQREIDNLRAKRREVEASLEGIITTLNKTIESVRDHDAQLRDHRPAAAPAQAPAARDPHPPSPSNALVAAASQPTRP